MARNGGESQVTDFYKDGYLEAVLFLFYKNGKILIEHRPKGNTKEIFIPNGRIDKKDISKNEDYRIKAMKREIREELGKHITIKNYLYLGEFFVEIRKIKFYGYLVLDWKGKIPLFTIENNKKHADLEWIPIRSYKKYLNFESASFFVEKAKRLIKHLKYGA